MSVRHRTPFRQLAAACGLIAVFGALHQALATVPVNPLPPPYYSFDLTSPSVEGGVVPASAILEFNLPSPLIGFKSSELGLVLPLDDLDALSGDHVGVPSDVPFAVLFSLDRDSGGLAVPDPTLVLLGLPYNATDQALRGHQAGDQFMSLELYTLQGDRIVPDQVTPNNILVRNNYDEGGTDFAAVPRTSAHTVIRRQVQDRIDASADLENGNTYYSATATSPSLAVLNPVGTPSGADIFYTCMRCNRQTPPQLLDQGSEVHRWGVGLYASFAQLGLQAADDIDALMVFDREADGVFNHADLVLFSLAPGSPTLNDGLGILSPAPAAHVLGVTPGGAPTVFIAAEQLGLGTPGDNVDALELLLCEDSVSCAQQHAIQEQELQCIGDLNDDGLVNGSDLAVLLGSWGPCPPPCASDLTGDGLVLADDLAALLGAWGICP